MKFKSVCKCLTAWTLSMSMILSSSAFMVQAGDWSDDAAAVTEAEIAGFTAGETVSEGDVPALEEGENPETGGEESSGGIEADGSGPEVPGEAGDGSEIPGEDISDGSGAGGDTSVPAEPGENPSEDPEADGGQPEEPPTEEEREISWSVEEKYGLRNDSGDDWKYIYPDSYIILKVNGTVDGDTVDCVVKYRYKDTEDTVKDPAEFLEVEQEEDSTFTLTGCGSSDSYDADVFVSVSNTEGKEVYNGFVFTVSAEKPQYYFHDYPDGYDPINNSLRVGDTRDISNKIGCDVLDAEHPDGDYVEVSYDIDPSSPGCGTKIEVSGGEGENWYQIKALDYGTATINATLKEKIDPQVEKSKTFKMEFFVSRDVYELETISPNPSSNRLRPGDTMVFNTIMHHSWKRPDPRPNDPDNSDEGYEQITNYSLEITSTEDEQKEWPVDATVQGTQILVTAPENAESRYCEIEVTAKALDEEGKPTGEECSSIFGVEVRGGFPELIVAPDEIRAVEELDPGKSTVIHPKVEWKDSADKVISDTDITYSWVWNKDIVEIKDADGNDLKEDDISDAWTGKAPFTIKKLKNDWTNLKLCAELGEEYGYEQVDLWMNASEQDYGIEFNTSGGRWDGENTYIYPDENLTLSLNTTNLNGLDDYTVKWSVISNGGSEGVSITEKDGYYSTGKSSITLHGDVLAKTFKDNTWVIVKARITEVNGSSVEQEYSASVGVEVRSSATSYEYYWPYGEPGERDLFPGEELYIDRMMSAFVDDAEHPSGEKVQVEILDVKAVNHWTWDDESEEDVKSPDPLVEIIPDADGWTIRAGEKGGWSQLELTCESLRPGEGTTTYSKENTDENGKHYFDVSIMSDKYSLKWTYPDDTNMLLLGEKMTVSSELTHSWIDKKGERQEKSCKNYTLKISDWYNDNKWVDAEIVADTSVKISSKSQDYEHAWYGSVPVYAVIPDESGKYDVNKPIEVCDSNIYVDVCYFTVEPSELRTQEDRRYNVDLDGELNFRDFDMSIIKWGAGEDVTDKEGYRISFKYTPEQWTVKSGTENDPIPVLIRKTTGATSITAVAEKRDFSNGNTGDWKELGAEREYTFGAVCGEDGHIWTMQNKPATCTEAGATIRRCTVCGVEVRADVPALDHVWEVTTEDANCVQGGTITKRCTRCGRVETETIPPRGHSWSTRTESPTCTSSGVRTTYCIVCGTVSSRETIPATGHTWVTDITAATCTMNGSAVTSCIVCGTVLDRRVIPAKGHTWGGWVTIQAATATTPEKQERVCKVCGARETREVSSTITPTPSPSPSPTPSLTPSPTPTPEPLETVEMKKAVSASYKSIKVTWDKVEGADGYIVYRKYAGKSWERIAKIGASRLSFTDKNVVTGTKYRYTVRAYRMEGSKEVLSSSFDRKGVVAKASLKKVAGLTATASAAGRNTIQWDSAAGATGYQIWCREGNTGKFHRIASVRNGLSYQHKGLKSGVTYSYRVRAFRKVPSGTARYVYGTLNKPQSVTAR